MPSGSPHPPAWMHFLTGFAVVAAAALLTVRLHETTFVHWADMQNLDAWILLYKPEPSREIVVVDVTDDDYRNLFDSRSPLAPARLRTLIWAVAATYPKIIGVDLDTSEWDPSERQWLRDKIGIDQAGVPGAVPVVWALGGHPIEDRVSGTSIEKRQHHVAFDAVNGGLGPYCWAVPVIIPDDDGVVRSYMWSVSDGGGRIMYGFAAAVATAASHGSAACQNTPPPSERVEPIRRIAFSGGRGAFVHLTASVVLGAAFSGAWKIDNPLRGKIVLVGGSYQPARDRYVTPVAYLDGVDVLAHSLQSLSSKSQLREAGKQLFLWIDLTLGVFLVFLTYWKKFWVEALTIVTVPLLALLGSLLVYDSLGYFASVVPVMLGVGVHRLLEHVVDHQRLKREVIRLRNEVQDLKRTG